VTPMETELSHLVSLMAPPFRENWKAYAWAKALELSADPEFAGLPAALKKAMQSDLNASGRNQPSTTNPRRSE
jgi:hypothetical protein